MKKVLLIGWDAADWKVIHPLVEQGKMPNTAALIERGVMGDLATLHPVLSPMLWTTIATGKRPYKHGILGFSEPTPDGGGVQPVSQYGRTTKALWNILNQQELRSHIIGWWPSHPVEPINGVMVSNHFHTAVGPPEKPWPLAPGMVHPQRVADTLAELRLNPNELIPEQLQPFVPDALKIDQDKDRRLGSVMKILAECTTVHAAATWAMANEPWDFMGVYYDAIDHFSHGFMRYHPPRRPHISEEDYQHYHGVVEAGYCFHDMMLGTLLELAPKDVTVIICSDHGFHSDHLRPVQVPNEPAGPAIEHRDLGMILIAGPGIKQDALIHGASLLDITPTILTLYGLPVGDDMDGKPLLDAFENPPERVSIPSWDEVPGDSARLSDVQQYNPIAAKEAMDQLVALGYIEAPGENHQQAVANTVGELRYNLARAYMDGGRYDEGSKILRELYETDPEQYRFGVQLALCLRASGEVKALRTLVEQLSADRKQAAVEAREKLTILEAEELERQREAGELTEDGKIAFNQMSEDRSKVFTDLHLLARFSYFDLDYLMGWVLGAEGDHQGALKHLVRAGRLEPRRTGLHVQIGESLIALRRWSEAEQAFRQALAIDPLDPHAMLGIAKACLRQKRVNEGIAAALDSTGLCYQNPMAHYILGLGLLRNHQYSLAVAAVQVAVALNPNFERAHRFLARYALTREYDRKKSRKHWDIVRRIRAKHSSECAKQQQSLTEAVIAGADALAPEPANKALQYPFNGVPEVVINQQPETLVDKSSVPEEPAECITIVTGLPRSGTSMMMQMLVAGGLPLLSDDKREADDDNPRGYYELEQATRLRQDQAWLMDAKGKVVKLVAQLLPALPAKLSYRVVFIKRDLDEVLRSQQVMLDRIGRSRSKLSDEQLQAAYRKQLQQVCVWLAKQPNLRTLFISHRQAIETPAVVAEQVNSFLGGSLDTSAMAAVVDGALYRQRTQ